MTPIRNRIRKVMSNTDSYFVDLFCIYVDGFMPCVLQYRHKSHYNPLSHSIYYFHAASTCMRKRVKSLFFFHSYSLSLICPRRKRSNASSALILMSTSASVCIRVIAACSYHRFIQCASGYE